MGSTPIEIGDHDHDDFPCSRIMPSPSNMARASLASTPSTSVHKVERYLSKHMGTDDFTDGPLDVWATVCSEFPFLPESLGRFSVFLLIQLQPSVPSSMMDTA